MKWTDKNGRIRSNSRKLQLVNVMKNDEGSYKCTIHAYGDPSFSYQVKVIGL